MGGYYAEPEVGFVGLKRNGADSLRMSRPLCEYPRFFLSQWCVVAPRPLRGKTYELTICYAREVLPNSADHRQIHHQSLRKARRGGTGPVG